MTALKEDLIAPCGMNCGICRAYLAYSRKFPRERGKVTHCIGCRPRKKQCAYIKGNCAKLRTGQIRFCFECADFPCRRLKTIDNRYRTRYNYSFIENLQEIKKSGIEEFLRKQEKRFKCPDCGGIVSVHDGQCYDCASRQKS